MATQLYDAALGEGADDKRRLCDRQDSLGWYLFLAEASLDHIGNYDPIYGSRGVPVFQAIGHDLAMTKAIPGVEERVARALTSDRAQPNGTLFKLLVAAAHSSVGGKVSFVPESAKVRIQIGSITSDRLIWRHCPFSPSNAVKHAIGWATSRSITPLID